MKKIYKMAMLASCALGLLMTNACTEKFEEMNTNPKIVTSELIDPGLLLTYVEWNSVVGNSSYGNGTYGCYCGMSTRGDNNPFNETDAPAEWSFQYGIAMNNLADIIHVIDSRKNKADLVNKTAIARILKAWSASKLTDTYGDVPYFESCLPVDVAVFQPKYDTQESIYKDLFKELKEAAAQLDASKASYGSADLIYGGNVEKWKKLANSLRLRLALRVRYADPALAAAQLSDLTEAGLITTVADDAYVKNTTEQQAYMNPRYATFIISYKTISEEVGTHQVMIDLLKNDGIHYDPRIRIYADTVMATFKGGISPNGYACPNWDYRGGPTLGNVPVEYKYPWGYNSTSKIADFWRVPVVAPAIMKCSEVYFALAEAKLFGLLPASFTGTANSYYQKGIDAGIEWAKWFYNLTSPQIPALMKNYVHNKTYTGAPTWTDAEVSQYLEYKKIDDATIAPFKATPIYTLSGSNEKQLEMIINQKMLALYPDEFQGWCEYRRTGYPKIPIGPDQSALQGKIPRRESWPTSEETRNADNYKEALKRYGSDTRLNKMWWDANPSVPYTYQWTPPSQPTPYM